MLGSAFKTICQRPLVAGLKVFDEMGQRSLQIKTILKRLFYEMKVYSICELV
jgi:hypothetical protein